MKKKIKWDSDKIVSFSAILISLMTLVVFIYQTSIQREQQELSVLPYLSIYNSNIEGEGYSLVLENNGIGPAFIESVTTSYKDSIYNLDLPKFFFQKTSITDSIKNIQYSNIYKGLLIPAGKSHKMISSMDRSNGLKIRNVIYSDEFKDTFDLKIIYRSIYNKKWRVSLQKPTPELFEDE